MDIFKDLIDELKDDNLIEQTVIEFSREQEESKKLAAEQKQAEDEQAAHEAAEEKLIENALAEVADDALAAEEEKPVLSEADFYRQRATNEVAFLQMVEAAFAGIERTQLKTVPQPFDDLEVQKVLHQFLQVSDSVNSPEYQRAEFQLLQETESWYSSLTLRDNRIMTAHLRRFLETSRPALSSPALIALARFYRNSPYTETVRSKFDLIVTRLFTKEAGDRRELVFPREEIYTHIKELYAEWSSVPLYSTDEDDRTIMQTAAQFEEFIREADDAKSFDALINTNFFNRLRRFKENTNEDFYAPLIAATGVEANVRIGNRYVALLEDEKSSGNAATLEDRYGLSHDSAISEATGKTLALSELLKEKTAPPAPKIIEEKKTLVVEPIAKREAKREAKKEAVKDEPKEKASEKKAGGGFNKWLVIAAAVAVVFVFGIYLGTKSSAPPAKEPAGAPKLNLENSMLREYLSEARIEDGTLNGIVLPAWNHLTEEKQRDALKMMLNVGGEKGYKRVNLTDKSGKTVGTATEGGIKVFE